MKYYKTSVSENIEFIRDEKDNSLAMDFSVNPPRILFADNNEELLKAAESLAGSRGRKEIVYDCSSFNDLTLDLLNKAGYELSKRQSILSVNIEELFSSQAVKKSLGISFPDVVWIPFRDLLLYQLEELVEEFEKAKIPLKKEDIERFDDDLSGIVYDKNGSVRAFVLVSLSGPDLLFECLHGIGGNDPKFIMSALQGFAKEITYNDLLGIYDRIIMLEMNGTVRPLIKRLLDNTYELSEPGYIICAKKSLPEKQAKAEFQDGGSVRVAKNLISEKLSETYYQSNINWKVEWEL
jgi:hypothetical protein